MKGKESTLRRSHVFWDPGTGLLGGKPTLLTTVDSEGDPCRMSDPAWRQKTGEFRGREVGRPGGENTVGVLVS